VAVAVVGVFEITAVEVVRALCICKPTANDRIAGAQGGTSGILAG